MAQIGSAAGNFNIFVLYIWGEITNYQWKLDRNSAAVEILYVLIVITGILGL